MVLHFGVNYNKGLAQKANNKLVLVYVTYLQNITTVWKFMPYGGHYKSLFEWSGISLEYRFINNIRIC